MHMNHSIHKKIYIALLAFMTISAFSHAATIVIDSPAKTSPNASPILVRIMLDPEKDILSGMSGNFSFPTDLFTLGTISTESSIVSLWIKQPKVSNEIYLDGRTHIAFEGIFPGGYDGVRSPYYYGVKPGVIFSVMLIPKSKGEGVLMVDDVLLNAYNSEATPLPAVSTANTIENPALTGEYLTAKTPMKEVVSSTLTTFIARDTLVNNNAWYVMVNEREQKSSIEKIYVAETEEYHASLVEEYAWHKEEVPYVLRNQQRTKYVHVKVVYSSNTYALVTLPPVENSQSIPLASRILISVALALLVLYVYAKYFFIPRSQQDNEKKQSS
jgi:hypothetical protein